MSPRRQMVFLFWEHGVFTYELPMAKTARSSMGFKCFLNRS